MDYFTKINAKLDIGWKYSDCSCPSCQKAALYNPETKTFHCISCEKVLDFQAVESEPQEQEMVLKPKQERVKDDTSSKLAKKLLEGWAMLEECCPDCLVPLMRPRKGTAVCVSCGFEWPNEKKAEKTEKKAEKPEKKEEVEKKGDNIIKKGREPEEQKKEKEKNMDKPRQISEGLRKSVRDAEKQNVAIENIDAMLANISRLYKEKVDSICKDGSIEAAQAFVKGPLAELVEVQGRFAKTCQKMK